jgi:hypothetical protein
MRVIVPLVELAADPAQQDNLENWLRVFFAFTRGKPVAYFSRYVPGPKIHAVARQHGVRVVHVPLDRIPAELRERNRTFRLLSLTDEQWEVLRRRIAAGKGARTVPREDEPGRRMSQIASESGRLAAHQRAETGW